MLLLNLKNLSSIDVVEPELINDVIYKDNQFVKFYKNNNDNYIQSQVLEYHVINNPKDIENIKRDFIIKEDKLYKKPSVTLKEVDGKTHILSFKTIDEFNSFIDNKLKPNYDLFFII